MYRNRRPDVEHRTDGRKPTPPRIRLATLCAGVSVVVAACIIVAVFARSSQRFEDEANHAGSSVPVDMVMDVVSEPEPTTTTTEAFRPEVILSTTTMPPPVNDAPRNESTSDPLEVVQPEPPEAGPVPEPSPPAPAPVAGPLPATIMGNSDFEDVHRPTRCAANCHTRIWKFSGVSCDEFRIGLQALPGPCHDFKFFLNGHRGTVLFFEGGVSWVIVEL